MTKSVLNWRCRNNEAAGQNLPWPSDYGSQPTHFNETIAANNKTLRNLVHTQKAFLEAELANAQTVYKDAISVEFFNLQIKKSWLMKFTPIFATTIWVVFKFHDLEKEPSSLHPVFAQREREDWIWPKIKANEEQLLAKACKESFSANLFGSFFPRTCCVEDKKKSQMRTWLFLSSTMSLYVKKFFGNTNCCCEASSNKSNLLSKNLIPRVLEKCAEASRQRHRCIVYETFFITSTTIGFGTNNHAVGANKILTELSYFHPKITRDWWNSR